MIVGKEQRMPDSGNATARPIVVFTRSFVAATGNVREVLIEMTDRLNPHVTPDLMGRAELALAELLNNVALHGRDPAAGMPPMVHLSVVAQPDGLACSVSDDGGLLPHVCLTSAGPDPLTHPEGGFGWFLIGHLAQSLVYFRERDRNFVAFTIPLQPPKPD